MKIAIAGVITKKIESHPLGGTELFTYLLVDGLVKRGHEVTLYCAKGTKTSAQRHIEICEPEQAMGQESNVEFVYPYTLLEIRQILQDIKQQNYDILHVNFLKTFLMSYFADQVSIPVLHTIHRDFLSNERLYDVYKKIGFHSNEYFVFVSKNAQRQSLLKENTHVIANGINLTDYSYVGKQDQESFLWLSRIDELKGPKEAAMAAKQVRVPLILSGDIDRDKYQRYFDQSIQPLLSDTIIYEPHSNQERKVQLYQTAKALLFTIQWEEPFGLVVVEAMSCGTPVIAFDRGAMSEIIEDGATGFLVKKEDGVDGIVQAIHKLNALSQESYEAMRQRCRERVEKYFSADRMVEDYEKLYRDLIKV